MGTVTVDWGDGTVDTFPAPNMPTSWNIGGRHRYLASGTYTIDIDGTSGGSKTLPVTITAPAPIGAITSFLTASSIRTFLIARPVVADGQTLIACLRGQVNNAGNTDFSSPGFVSLGPPFVSGDSVNRLTSIQQRPVVTASLEPATYTFTRSAGNGRIAAVMFTVTGLGNAQPAGHNPTYGGTFSDNGVTEFRTTDAFANEAPDLQVFAGGAEFGTAVAGLVTVKPPAFIEKANLFTAGDTTVARSSLWVGTREIATPQAPSTQIGWPSAVTGGGAGSVTLRGPSDEYLFGVAEMLAKAGFTWAYRGNSTYYAEMSKYAYLQANRRGFSALEFSMARTSDGVWFGLHDADINRTSGLSTGVRTNVATNPALEGGVVTGWSSANSTLYPVTLAGVAAVEQTNLAMNPNCQAGITGWLSNGPTLYPITADTTAPISGTTSAMTTRTATTLDTTAGSINASGMVPQARLPVTGGQAYTISIDIKAELPSRRGRVYFNWYDTGGTLLGNSGLVYQPLADVTVTRLTHTATAPAGAVTASPIISAHTNTGNATAGERVWYDNLLIEKDPTATSAVDATNRAVNPIGTTPPTTWWLPSRVTVAAGADYLRCTITDATVGALLQRLVTPFNFSTAPDRVQVVAGDQVRISAEVMSPKAFPMATGMAWFDSANAQVATTIFSPSTTSNAATWTTIPEFLGTVPAGAVTAQLQVGIASGARLIGDTFDVRKVQVTVNAPLVAYFDGGTLPSGDNWYRWTGTVSASTSERLVISNRTTPTPTYYDGATTAVGLYTYRWTGTVNASTSERLKTAPPISGTRSALSIRTSATLNTTVATFQITGMTGSPAYIPISNGVPVSFSLDIMTEVVDRRVQITLNQYDSAGVFIVATAPVIVVASTQPGVIERPSFTITPNAAGAARGFLIVAVIANTGTGNAAVGERVWADRLMIENAASTDGIYFDGATADTAVAQYDWVGPANTSTSTRTGSGLAPAAEQMTWAQVQAYPIINSADGVTQPYYRLDNFLTDWADTHVLVLDPKYAYFSTGPDAGLTQAEFWSVVAGLDPDRVIIKGSVDAVALAAEAKARGYQSWGYGYQADVENASFPTWQADWTILGLNNTAPQATWDAIQTYGKPVVGHDAATPADYALGMSKGADGIQCAGSDVILAVNALSP